jgi:hypothetical protein
MFWPINRNDILTTAITIVSVTQGHFFPPDKNALLLKQLSGLKKMPLRDLYFIWGGDRNDDRCLRSVAGIQGKPAAKGADLFPGSIDQFRIIRVF